MATNSRPYASVGMASLLWRWQAAGGGSVPAGPGERLFFSSGMADVALWLGPYMSINCQNYICTRTQKVHKCRQIKSHQTTHKTHNQDDPKIPQPDLRFVKKQKQQRSARKTQDRRPAERQRVVFVLFFSTRSSDLFVLQTHKAAPMSFEDGPTPVSPIEETQFPGRNSACRTSEQMYHSSAAMVRKSLDSS